MCLIHSECMPRCTCLYIMWVEFGHTHFTLYFFYVVATENLHFSGSVCVGYCLVSSLSTRATVVLSSFLDQGCILVCMCVRMCVHVLGCICVLGCVCVGMCVCVLGCVYVY